MPQVQTLAIIPVSRCFSSHHPCFLTATVQVGDAVSSFQQRPKNVRVSSFKIHLLSRLINFFICFFFFLLSANPLFLKVGVLEGICIFVYGSLFWSGICERTQLYHLLGLFSLGLWKWRARFFEKMFSIKAFNKAIFIEMLMVVHSATLICWVMLTFLDWLLCIFENDQNDYTRWILMLCSSQRNAFYTKKPCFLRKLCQWAHFSCNIFETYWRMRMNSGSKFTFPWSVN